MQLLGFSAKETSSISQFNDTMSQDQKTTPIPIPTIYEDEQEMLNRNGEPVSHPQPHILLLEGVPQEDQPRVLVQELSEAVVMREAAFEGLGSLCTHLGTNRISRCVSRAKTKKPNRGLF